MGSRSSKESKDTHRQPRVIVPMTFHVVPKLTLAGPCRWHCKTAATWNWTKAGSHRATVCHHGPCGPYTASPPNRRLIAGSVALCHRCSKNQHGCRAQPEGHPPWMSQMASPGSQVQQTSVLQGRGPASGAGQAIRTFLCCVPVQALRSGHSSSQQLPRLCSSSAMGKVDGTRRRPLAPEFSRAGVQRSFASMSVGVQPMAKCSQQWHSQENLSPLGMLWENALDSALGNVPGPAEMQL